MIEILIDKDYKINAQASNGNLITIDIGTIDTFSGDISALAAVISHEMAHHVLKHEQKLSKYQKAEEKKLEDSITEEEDTNNVITDSIQIPIIKIYQHKTNDKSPKEKPALANDSNADLLALSRMYEYEADKTGLLLMTRAGFHPNGEIRVFEFTDKLAIDALEENSTHPDNLNRIIRAKSEIKSLDINTLKQEGLSNIKNSKPLTYEKYRLTNKKYLIKKTLVIHSKYSTNKDKIKPFEELFGN